MNNILERAQILAMLMLQAEMNTKVNPAWLTAGYPYLRANVVEGAEAMEHHGWKWWKHQQKDLPQMQMELIDIWHFMLSHLIVQSRGDMEPAATALQALLRQDPSGIDFDGTSYEFAEEDTVRRMELLIGISVSRRVSIPLFRTLLVDCGMEWTDLYRQYIAKNVLNIFRQDHGYKEGTYHKMWEGREDNVHLVEVMDGLDLAHPAFRDQVYGGLQLRYPAVTGVQA